MENEKCIYCREYGNLPCEKCDKKDKTKIYLDLSKLSGEEIKEVISKLPEPLSEKDYHITRQHIYLMYHGDDENWWVGSKFPYWHLEKRTEISLSEFRQLRKCYRNN